MKIDIKNIKANPNNPRIIKDERYKRLLQSIKDFPEMLEKRPLVCFTDTDGKFVVLGGNMRLKAAKELKMTELPIMLADDWTEEQKAEFLIKDNVSFGEWNWDELKADWDSSKLEEWGLEVPEFGVELDAEQYGEDYSEKNKELDESDFENQKYTLKLEFTEQDYEFVKGKLQALGVSPEKILYNALVSL